MKLAYFIVILIFFIQCNNITLNEKKSRKKKEKNNKMINKIREKKNISKISFSKLSN
jgi:uncharacterized membrane protein